MSANHKSFIQYSIIRGKNLGIGIPELAIILVMVLFVFGAKKLPGIGGDMGKGIRNFKKEISESDESATERNLR